MDIILKLILLIPIILSTVFLFINIGIWAIFPFWFLCGLIDISRHKTMDLKLIKEYFIGKGFLTFLLSPLNLLSDLLSHRNLHTYKIEDLPQGHQNEINDVISLFDKKSNDIAKRFKENPDDNRTMLFYKWYGYKLDDSIEEFNNEYKYLKTIGAVSYTHLTLPTINWV